MSGFLTVTSQVLLTPSTVTVMIAVPCFTAQTVPEESTVATLFLFVFHFGLLLEEAVTESRIFSFRKRETELLLSLTEGCFTVTLQLFDVLSAVTVMVAVPGFFARITPSSSTDATLDLLDLYLTGCPVETEAFSFAL